MKIGSIYKHIDNGGVSVEVHQTDDESKSLSIVFNTSYHGHPDITSSLNLWGGRLRSDEFLKELGVMFIEASKKVG